MPPLLVLPLTSDNSNEPSTPRLGRRMSQRLEALDVDFKTHHLAVIDVMGDDNTDGHNTDSLAQEQEMHNDEVASLAYCLEQLTRARPPGADTRGQIIATRHLSQLETKFSTLNTAIGKLTGDPREIRLVHLYQEQFSDCKRELGDIHTEVLSLMVDESDDGSEDGPRGN